MYNIGGYIINTLYFTVSSWNLTKVVELGEAPDTHYSLVFDHIIVVGNLFTNLCKFLKKIWNLKILRFINLVGDFAWLPLGVRNGAGKSLYYLSAVALIINSFTTRHYMHSLLSRVLTWSSRDTKLLHHVRNLHLQVNVLTIATTAWSTESERSDCKSNPRSRPKHLINLIRLVILLLSY